MANLPHSETFLMRKEKGMLGEGEKEGRDRRNCPTQRKGNEISTQIETLMSSSLLQDLVGFFSTRGSAVPSECFGWT